MATRIKSSYLEALEQEVEGRSCNVEPSRRHHVRESITKCRCPLIRLPRSRYVKINGFLTIEKGNGMDHHALGTVDREVFQQALEHGGIRLTGNDNAWPRPRAGRLPHGERVHTHIGSDVHRDTSRRHEAGDNGGHVLLISAVEEHAPLNEAVRRDVYV